MQVFDFIPDQASTFAPRVDSLYLFLVLVSAVLSLIIVVFLVYFAVKYRRRPGHHAVEVQSSLSLELAWTLIPAGITMVMFFWGATLYLSESVPPRGARDIFVVGQQWMWKIQHANGRREINELHVPVNQAVKLTLTSQDVIHSFFVPAFRIKQDAVPGQYRTLWFEATLPGEYHLFCAEYCGTNHSRMIGRVVVMSEVDYQDWLAGTTGETPEESGENLFNSMDCAGCHASGGAQQNGPVLEGRYGMEVPLAAGGTVLFDENYIRESVFSPDAQIARGLSPGMPSYRGRISEEQLFALVAYIRSLTPDPQSGGVEGGGR